MEHSEYDVGDIVEVKWNHHEFDGEILAFGENETREPCAFIAVEDIPLEVQEEEDESLENWDGRIGIKFHFAFLGRVNRDTWVCHGCERRRPSKDRVDYLCRECRGMR